jgi:hypothetical protein
LQKTTLVIKTLRITSLSIVISMISVIYAECKVFIVVLIVTVLNVIMLSVTMLNVVMLNVVLLNVGTPRHLFYYAGYKLTHLFTAVVSSQREK